jgi:hypothetical protein
MAMLTESEVRLRAVRWRFIALVVKHDNAENANAPFSKSNAYMDVLNIPWSTQGGKLSRDGLNKYCESMLPKWLDVASGAHSVNEWMNENLVADFENHI